ncbi:hypothetical protein [Microscilla marina]|uniref:hypothetical protein n=1 Tax=Microscilla marina TaxID=1027 RepID=UPI0012FA5F8C|nr:hypothetical protein [Microscilla marina]
MMIKLTRTLSLLFSISVIMIGCKLTNTNYNNHKSKQTNEIINSSLWLYRKSIDDNFKHFKKNVKTRKKLWKIQSTEELIRRTMLIDNKIRNIKANWDKKLTDTLCLNLEQYNNFLQINHASYLRDTTSWSKRYLRVLPQVQQANPPSFAEFYFKGTSQEEAIAILSTLQLGILQEALAIQRRIFKEAND